MTYMLDILSCLPHSPNEAFASSWWASVFGCVIVIKLEPPLDLCISINATKLNRPAGNKRCTLQINVIMWKGICIASFCGRRLLFVLKSQQNCRKPCDGLHIYSIMDAECLDPYRTSVYWWVYCLCSFNQPELMRWSCCWCSRCLLSALLLEVAELPPLEWCFGWDECPKVWCDLEEENNTFILTLACLNVSWNKSPIVHSCLSCLSVILLDGTMISENVL